MLTKDDLNQIKKIVEPIQKDINTLNKDMSTLKKDVAETRKDVKVLIAYFDREYVELRKRIDRIEEHLGLSDKN
jgi:predicted  nucleic acid-binding Zn-ribbon protein